MNLKPYSKAFVPVFVGLILYLLGVFHVTGQMNVQDAATTLVSAVLVYFVPNRQA